MTKDEKAALGKALQSLRKKFRGESSGGGSVRRIAHDPEAKYCLCIDCRTARGHYPPKITAAERRAKRRAAKRAADRG